MLYNFCSWNWICVYVVWLVVMVFWWCGVFLLGKFDFLLVGDCNFIILVVCLVLRDMFWVDVFDFFFWILVLLLVGFCMIDKSFVVMLFIVLVSRVIVGGFFFFNDIVWWVWRFVVIVDRSYLEEIKVDFRCVKEDNYWFLFWFFISREI